MAFSTGSSSGGLMADINVTPLVDVMLVLLIIFMITTPLMNHKTKVELPKVVLAPPKVHQDEKTAPVTLFVRKDGVLLLDDQPITEGGLQDRLAVVAQKKPQPVLNIRADRDTKMQILKKMTGIATQAGMLNVGYVTVRPKPGEQQ